MKCTHSVTVTHIRTQSDDDVKAESKRADGSEPNKAITAKERTEWGGIEKQQNEIKLCMAQSCRSSNDGTDNNSIKHAQHIPVSFTAHLLR